MMQGPQESMRTEGCTFSSGVRRSVAQDKRLMALRTCAQIAGVKIDSADGLIEGPTRLQ